MQQTRPFDELPDDEPIPGRMYNDGGHNIWIVKTTNPRARKKTKYTGIRRAELASVKVEDGWVHIVTAKQRKGYKEKLRSQPIPPMLEEHMPHINLEEIKKLTPHILTKHLNRLCKNHHLHDLRHTFSTRAKECQIQREYISLWVGHKADNSLTSNVYIHLDQNKELQQIEMQKFQYQL